MNLNVIDFYTLLLIRVTPTWRHWRHVLGLTHALHGQAVVELYRAAVTEWEQGDSDCRAGQPWCGPSTAKPGKWEGSTSGIQCLATVGILCTPVGKQGESASHQVPFPRFPSILLEQLGLGVYKSPLNAGLSVRTNHQFKTKSMEGKLNARGSLQNASLSLASVAFALGSALLYVHASSQGLLFFFSCRTVSQPVSVR